jgi:hypothetical protein
VSHVIIVNRSQLLAAATVISAVGFLTVSPPAQAHPMLPLAPACNQYGFNGDFSLKQSNGPVVRFNATGPVASGTATATGAQDFDSQRILTGTISGGIQGDNVDFTISWGVVPASTGHYTGSVGNDGFAHGNTDDTARTGAGAHWDSTVPLVCTTPAAPAPAPAAAPPQNPLLSEPATEVPNRRVVPPAAPPGPAGAQVATVTSDVDVYDVPGGNGNKIGVLRSGRQVPLVGSCKPNDWCDVVIPELPGGSGWMWDQFLKF